MFVLKHDVLFLTLPMILFTCHILQTDFWDFFGAFHSIPSILLFLSQLVWNVLRPSNSEYLEDLWSRWGITLNRLYRLPYLTLCIVYTICTLYLQEMTELHWHNKTSYFGMLPEMFLDLFYHHPPCGKILHLQQHIEAY